MKLGLAHAEDVSRRVKAALIYLGGGAASPESHDAPRRSRA